MLCGQIFVIPLVWVIDILFMTVQDNDCAKLLNFSIIITMTVCFKMEIVLHCIDTHSENNMKFERSWMK